jgi:gas vesicle protein
MNAGIQNKSSNHGRTFLLGLVAGTAVGTGFALYFSPRLVSELRQRVTDSAGDLRSAASERLQAVAARLARVVDRVADAADDATRRGQGVRDDLADAVGRGAREVIRGALEVEQFAMASKTDHTSTRS